MAAEDDIDELYGLPLEEFTVARNALAKRLRADGREEAAEVAKLRKPSRPAWAINRVARERPELADAVLDAAADLAAAQEAVVAGSGREALDDAVSAERAAVEDFVAAARAELDESGSASPTMVDRARRTLHAVAGDPGLQAELAAARIVADREPIGFGAVAAVAPAKRRSPAAKTKPKSRRKAATEKAGAEEARREREARAEAERESRKRMTEVRRRAQQAERRFEKRERDLERARERLAEAREAAAAAEEEVAELAEDLQRRRKELEDARAVLAELS